MNRRLVSWCGVLLCAGGLSAAEKLLLDGWQFSRDLRNWEAVSVPHDWAIGGPFSETNDLQITTIRQDGEVRDKRHTGRTGGLPWPGKGWYRRELRIPAGIEYAELVFDGAMSEAVVSADGVEVGHWMNGYNSFIVPIPPATKKIEVALDNPPASSRWYPGSGLIRPVRLRTGGKMGIATWGNCIRTESLSDDEAKISVVTQLREADATCQVSWTLIDPSGAVAAKTTASVAAGTAKGTLTVAAPRRWSPEAPNLYRLETRLCRDAKELDLCVDRIGLRTAGFTREGFFLNGKKRPFRGVCLHHDLGSIGAAFNKSAFRRQIRLLKELGVDAIRTSHNMPAPDQMDICDEEGVMVMAESFDMWMTHETKNDYARHFPTWWRRDLDNLLRCHRNHPSIVMWSIGNEIHEKDTQAVREVAREMTAICHRMDPSRPVVFVTDRPDAYTESGAIQETDVPALTYRLHRYEFMHAHSPIGLVLGGETASTFSSRGCYHFPDEVIVNAEHPNGQATSYDLEHGSWSNLPDDDWAMQDDHPWAIGEFVWTGFDYLGEPTPYKEYWPARSSYFGIFDLAGIPKDRYWLYRTRWRPDSPTLHVLPHWTWPGREGQVTPVYVYTSYPEAELFVNGVSQGRKRHDRSSRLDRYRLRWRNVVYAPGELRVVAYDGNGQKMGEKVVKTAGEPFALRVMAERPTLKPSAARDGEVVDMPELGYFRVQVVDAAGNVCPHADNRINVAVLGAATFKGICNGDATSLESLVEPTMKAFHGELVVTVSAERKCGICKVVVTSPGLREAYVTIPVRAE
ncbi:MAG: DUF4982 domain-containing protein [Kiritimatiellae bacterium]|nr:DUF4982 domain-containing protein [Kiritimatiellia bacterium]